MTDTPQGQHLIAGHWTPGEATFLSEPAHGPALAYATGTVALVARACAAAAEAFVTYGQLRRAARADFLDRIAAEIEARGPAITAVGHAETGLPEARLEGERGRTTGQLRLFAAHVRKGDYLDRRIDPALPERKPAPRPEIRLIERPIGPVAVFGASNFPLAFSTAGGDTAAALAAGCPVVVKGHSAHPGTSQIVAEAVLAAVTACGLHPGVFSLIQGGNRAVGQALVQDPHIRAVGFTGSLGGGRALFDLCAARPEPIPFFGELGSVNPIFVLPGALAARGAEIGAGWAASLTLGAGQFCTNPGIVLLPPGAEAFVAAATEALGRTAAQAMLTPGIARTYHAACATMASRPGLRCLVQSPDGGRLAGPHLFETDAATFRADPHLQEEIFGASGLIVHAGETDMAALAEGFPGQLTMTLQMENSDLALAQSLMPILERKAGRVLVNGFPTGVEVVDAMVHGGPYPASTNFGATSVGTLSIRRFLRPVSYQNLSQALLPEDLRD